MGEEGAASGISKVVGRERNGEKKYATLRNFSQSKKCKKTGGADKNRAETGIKGYGRREVKAPLSNYYDVALR